MSSPNVDQSSVNPTPNTVKNMREPSDYVKNVIEKRSVVRPDSIAPVDFRNLWSKARELVSRLTVELTRHDADFQQMNENSNELVDLVARLRVADASLRRETPNGKRPRSYPCPELDHAPEIESSLLRALSCVSHGERAGNLDQLYRHIDDARNLISDARFEFHKTQGR